MRLAIRVTKRGAKKEHAPGGVVAMLSTAMPGFDIFLDPNTRVTKYPAVRIVLVD